VCLPAAAAWASAEGELDSASRSQWECALLTVPSGACVSCTVESQVACIAFDIIIMAISTVSSKVDRRQNSDAHRKG